MIKSSENSLTQMNFSVERSRPRSEPIFGSAVESCSAFLLGEKPIYSSRFNRGSAPVSVQLAQPLIDPRVTFSSAITLWYFSINLFLTFS